MRTKVTILSMFVTASAAMAQVLNVASIEKVELPADAIGSRIEISGNGKAITITDNGYKGLQVMTLADKKLTTISTENGSGFNAKFNDDATVIAYREQSMATDNAVLVAVKSFDMKNRVRETVVEPVHGNLGYCFSGVSIKSTIDKKVTTKKLARKVIKSAEKPLITYEMGQIIITMGTEVKVLSPNGDDHPYVWASISPNGKMACFYDVYENATFLCDINGENVQRISNEIRDAKWLSDNILVGMRDKDNGRELVSSSIVAIDLNDNEQVLTPENQVAVYPSVTLKGDKIAYYTNSGEAYIINVKL